jgi:phosphoribosylformimino-5-aminoimidazole carboxamide ribotide isomerase
VLTLYPAIDIRDGGAVRLLRGDYERETRYDADPVDAARRWADGGAEIIHVVDLDGARAGAPANLAVVERITTAIDIPVQVGGGLRDETAVEAAFAAGAQRVVLGTGAQRDPDLMARLVAAHGDRIVAAVDARGNRVAIEGWEEPTETSVPSAIRSLADRGVRRFVYTPVEVDGTLEGPTVDVLDPILEACAATAAELIYSGGVGSLQDLERLAACGSPHLTGVIVGRALYERRFTVGEALVALGT